MAYGETYTPSDEIGKEDTKVMTEVDEEEQPMIAETADERSVSEEAAIDLRDEGQEEPAAVPKMSQEQVLLLQLLRRAKRQQDLIMEVQKGLKALAGIERSVDKTIDQVKQIQLAIKDTQRQIVQLQRQLNTIGRAQEKGFQTITAKQKKTNVQAKKSRVLDRKRTRSKSKRK